MRGLFFFKVELCFVFPLRLDEVYMEFRKLKKKGMDQKVYLGLHGANPHCMQKKTQFILSLTRTPNSVVLKKILYLLTISDCTRLYDKRP